MHLAVFKTNYLGDNVVFLPVVQTLRARYPDWRITLITAPAVAPLYAADIAVADLLTVEPETLKRMWHHPAAFGGWWSELRRRKIDASLVSYDQSSVAHALAWLAGGCPRVGAAELRIRLQGTLTQDVSRSKEWSIARWNWEIARTLVAALGKSDWPAEPSVPDLSHLLAGASVVPQHVVIHAGSKWEYTRWPQERFIELAGRLARDHEVWWIYAPELPPCAVPARVRLVESQDLGTLVRLLAGAALFVGNNSGPMHIANALGVPLVVISGPTDFAWDPAWHDGRATVLRTAGLACLPCDKVPFAAGRCQNAAEPLACMKRWSVSAVEAACRNALDRVVGA